MHFFQQNLKYIKQQLKIWNKETFGNILQEKLKLTQKMEQLQQDIINEGRTDSLVQEEKHLQTQINEREIQEEILWKQKSRIRWLKEGEKIQSSSIGQWFNAGTITTSFPSRTNKASA
jgi:hypothetical protein